MSEKGIVEYETDKGKIRLSPGIVRKYLVSGTGTVSDQEIMMFMALCRYQNLNPFLREAYLIKYGNSNAATIVVGKDTFTKRAHRRPDFDGFEAGIIVDNRGDPEERQGTYFDPEKETLVGGFARVYRKEIKIPFTATVTLNEYQGTKQDGTPTRQWSKMPGTMIRKVALVQALREAFPEDFQGLYSPEEMPIGQDLPTDEVHMAGPEEQAPAPTDAEMYPDATVATTVMESTGEIGKEEIF